MSDPEGNHRRFGRLYEGYFVVNKIIAALSILFFSTSCAQGREDKGALIPPTKIHITELIFANDLPQHYFIAQYDGYRICRDSEVPKNVEKSLVAGILQTESMSLGDPETCQISYLKEKNIERKYDFSIKKNGCDFNFIIFNNIVRRLDVVGNINDLEAFNKCAFRSGLFSMGFNGALDIDDERLFVPRSKSFWAAFPEGENYVPLIQFFLAQCDFKMRKFASRQDVIAASQNMECKTLK